MTTLLDVSPTYLSSDLFSPLQKDRTTIPTNGVQEISLPPIGGKTWEQNITTYGGIGKLPFLGSVKTRDLHVPRSHRHFGSGFATYLAEVQPQDLTSLKKSSCRLNDQLLPAVFKTVIDHKSCKQPAILDNNAYMTHIPKFEVFPRHDQHRINNTGKSELCEATQNAIDNYHQKIYNLSRYEELFTDQSDVIKPNLVPKSSRPVRYIMKCSEESLPQGRVQQPCKQPSKLCSSQQTKPRKVKFKDGPCWPPSESYKIGLRFRLCEDDRKFGLKTDSRCTRPWCTICRRKDTADKQTKEEQDVKPPVQQDETKTEESEPEDHVCKQCEEGCHQCWAIQLHRSTISPYKLQQVNSGKTCVCKLCKDFRDDFIKSRQIFNYWPPERKTGDVIKRTPPMTPGSNKSEMANIDTSSPKDPEYNENLPLLDVTHLKYPRQPFPTDPLYADQTGPTYLPPIPLADCVSNPGDRIPLKLGLRYKTEAYKRFHAMHPDNIPDLREPKKDRKRYFFYGYHTSAFRG